MTEVAEAYMLAIPLSSDGWSWLLSWKGHSSMVSREVPKIIATEVIVCARGDVC